MKDPFEIVGILPSSKNSLSKKARPCQGFPLFSAALLFLILSGCFACELIMTKDPAYMDLKNCSVPPNSEFLFGTDPMGRDIFSMIWHGGRISLSIGIVSALISTAIGIAAGTAGGMLPKQANRLLERFMDILISVPNLLIVILIQAALGSTNVLSLSLVIGMTGWMSIAKVVQTQVRQIRSSEYVLAAKCMGGSLPYILRKHLAPNFVSSILFMSVMNIRSAIAAESTLSFMGIGLPLKMISWGSMLSLAEKALTANSWWIILIPGLFLITALSCITGLGNYLRKSLTRRQSNF